MRTRDRLNKSFFVPESGLPFDESLSRRDFLRWGLYGGGVIVAPMLPSTQGCGFQPLVKAAALSAMPWLGWDKEAFVAAALSWFVNRYAEPLLPDVGQVRSAALALAEKLGLKKKNKPSPTGDGFHNSHAENYVVTNRDYHGEMDPGKIGCCVKLTHYLRCGVDTRMARVGDLSALELREMAKYHQKHSRMLLPHGRRWSLKHPVLKYVRTFTDIDRRSRIKGYGYLNKQDQKMSFYLT